MSRPQTRARVIECVEFVRLEVGRTTIWLEPADADAVGHALLIAAAAVRRRRSAHTPKGTAP